MNLFIFFALPVATILLSIVLQRILKSPILVAITFFAIYLIVSFAEYSANLAVAIIATIIYSIIAFITASVVQFVHCIIRRFFRVCNDNNLENNLLENQALISNEIGESSCTCASNRTGNDVAITANFVPSETTNGRTGSFRGCYRRR